MSMDIAELRAALARHGSVTRVVIVAADGSTPREVGASMLVWRNGQSGTIGGGTLEYQAAEWARSSGAYLRRVPLGPSIGQCCGGAVTLLAESYADISTLPEDGYLLRRVEGDAETPLAMRRAISAFRNSGKPVAEMFSQGWFLEPVEADARPLWIYGAGHVGRAMLSILAPLPQFAITWVDTGPDRFPEDMPSGVTQLVSSNPADSVGYAPPEAEHLILTYSHAFDLEICHRLLGHGFSWAGLIGSETKWARFRSRLRALGHTDAQISRINCPIGDKSLGKHPQAIAIGVASRLLSRETAKNSKAMGDMG